MCRVPIAYDCILVLFSVNFQGDEEVVIEDSDDDELKALNDSSIFKSEMAQALVNGKDKAASKALTKKATTKSEKPAPVPKKVAKKKIDSDSDDDFFAEEKISEPAKRKNAVESDAEDDNDEPISRSRYIQYIFLNH